MEKASNFEARNESNRLIHDLAKLNKNLKSKPNNLERLKYLQSVKTEYQLCVDHCIHQIEMIERIHEYEKEFPSGSDYPLAPDPSPSKNAAAQPLLNSGSEPVNHPESKVIHEAGKAAGINLFCKSMPLNIPRDHFKIFTENNRKNGKPFLTSDQLDSFIERAFCGNNLLPVQKINYDLKGEKIKIQNVFYAFYCNTVKDYFQTDNCRDNFIRLLTDNFTGWDFDKVKKNFSKHTKHCFNL